jgi:hypothetical protein
MQKRGRFCDEWAVIMVRVNGGDLRDECLGESLKRHMAALSEVESQGVSTKPYMNRRGYRTSMSQELDPEETRGISIGLQDRMSSRT